MIVKKVVIQVVIWVVIWYTLTMAFKPNYIVTDRIVNNLTQIAVAREVIERSRIIPKWEISLRREARIHNAHSSTSIEGNRLNLDQVEALSEKKEVISTPKDKNEVLNYLAALDKIPEYAKKKSIAVKTFLDIHKILTHKVMQNLTDSGMFRTRQVFVGRRVFDGTGFKDVVEYMPPETEDVPRLIKEFLQWLNSTSVEQINPVILAGIGHYEVARIHPFIDGNGRIARLFASLILYMRDFDHRRFFALDDYYDNDRQSYYDALKTADNSDNDITEWLEYFTDGVLYSVERVKEIVLKLGLVPKKDNATQIELTPRQLEIVERTVKNGKITNKEIQQMYSISRQAVLKEIAKLTEAGILGLVGKGKGAYYELQ